MLLRAPARGVGLVKHVGIDVTIIYIGRNEWLTEHVAYASVEFVGGHENVRLSDIIDERQVSAYDSLRAGDFIVYGKKKNARAIVMNVLPRLSKHPNACKNRVIVLDNGVKRTLSVKQCIMSVQHITDVR